MMRLGPNLEIEIAQGGMVVRTAAERPAKPLNRTRICAGVLTYT
jgi:hypothetical protein